MHRSLIPSSLVIALTFTFTVAACTDDGNSDSEGTETGDTTEDGTDTTDSETGTDSETESDSTDSTDSTDGETSESDTGIAIDCDADAWDIDAEFEWKSAWMAECMVPAITPLMQAIDAERFADFSCENCHGEDFAGGTFAMPATTPLSWDEAATWDPDFFDGMTFMGPMGEVAGTAAATLGYEPFSMDNPDGFGCGGCHQGL